MTETAPPSPKVLAVRRRLTGAERQRRWRERQKLGRRVIAVELEDSDIERLVDRGLLTFDEARNDKNIAGAIARLVGPLNGTGR